MGLGALEAAHSAVAAPSVYTDLRGANLLRARLREASAAGGQAP